MTRHAGAVLSAFINEGEELWQGGARKALDELEAQTEERAMVLAQEAAAAPRGILRQSAVCR